MEDYTICDDWGEGSGLELHEKNCNEDQIGNKFYQTYHNIISISFSLMNVLSKIVELYRKKVGAFNPKCGEYQTLFLF